MDATDHSIAQRTNENCAMSCLNKAYGDVRDAAEQVFWHQRAQVYATLSLAHATMFAGFPA